MKTAATCLVLCCAMVTTAWAEEVDIVCSQAPTPQSNYAVHKLSEALEKRGFTVGLRAIAHGRQVRLSINPSRLEPEAFSITPRGRVIAITGGDSRGLIYGALA